MSDRKWRNDEDDECQAWDEDVEEIDYDATRFSDGDDNDEDSERDSDEENNENGLVVGNNQFQPVVQGIPQLGLSIHEVIISQLAPGFLGIIQHGPGVPGGLGGPGVRGGPGVQGISQLGLSEEEFAQLRVYKPPMASEADQGSVSKVCGICHEVFEKGDRISLPCGPHHYHSGCITKWLRENLTCPLCRSNVRNELAKSAKRE